MAGKKDIVEQALKLIMGEGEKAARTGIKAYHSSPHDFDKFDLSKIGTGEGNQVYGRGLYFAESPAVSGQGGDYWRQFWNKMKSGSEATAANAMWANKFDRDKAISSVESQARYYRDLSKPGKYGNGPDVEEGNRLLAEEYERALELLRDGGIVGPRTYEVNIETTPDKLIDWDKPALKQPDNVLSTIKPFYESIPERKQYGETFTGGDLYRDFVKRSGGVMHSPKIDAAGIPEVLPGGSEERATRFLASKGVPGLQYLDGISRKYGDGTRNYVIFDDKIVDIEKKYEDGGAVREGYSGKGRVVGDIVDQAMKLITGEGEQAAKKAINIKKSDPFPVDYIEPGSLQYRYEHPDTNSFMEIITRPKGARSASVIGLEVPEKYRGTGIGKALQERVLQDFPSLMGQVSSKAAAVNAYKAGRRPLSNPNATIEDVFRMIDEDSSVNLATPEKSSGGAIREGYAGRGRVVGDIVDQALKLVTGEGEEAAKTGIRAYHGSPHDFDKFDMSKIGTGEGAQAYGHGLYFAEREGIARGYRDALSPKKVAIGGQMVDSPTFFKAARRSPSVDDNIAMLTKQRENILKEQAQYTSDPELGDFVSELYDQQLKDVDKELAELSQYRGQWFGTRPGGSMYEVNIAADPNTFLDWDKPLSEQPQNVLDVARPFFSEGLPERKQYGEIVKGGDLYDMLTKRSGGVMHSPKLDAAGIPSQLPGGTKERLGMYLSSQGVPGIKYLDAGSRGAGDGTRNYVVFDDKLISIIRKYGIAGASAMLGYNLMENLDPKQAQAATVADKEYQANQPEIRGGRLPAGMEPSGEMTSRIPSASDRIYDYIMSVLGGDEGTKAQRAQTVMNIIDQTPLAVGPIAYDIGRGVTEAVMRADGGAVDPYAEEVASAKKMLADKAYNDQSWSDWVGDAAENAVRTARSILPTALGGEGSVGISDIARGAYEGGKDAVMFPGDVITGKQALFDEAGRPLESAVGRSFNTAATVGGASSVVPRPANSVGVFGGIKSLTADRNALTKAQIMESRGASPDDIWNQTGWGRGTDGQWRYEIPDVNSSVDPAKLQMDLSQSAIPTPLKAALSEYLDHPEFFKAYPEFRNMEVRTHRNQNNRGYYMPRFDRGTINPGFSDPYISLNFDELENNFAAQRSTLLHEIQHAIQQKEGFSPGSNSNNFVPDTIISPKYLIYQDALINDSDMKNFKSLVASDEYKGQLNAANKFFNDNFKDRFKVIEQLEDAGIDVTGEYGKLTKEYEEAVRDKFPAMKKVGQLSEALKDKGIPFSEPRKFLAPFEAYYQHAGEVEARNVQERMHMTPEQLRQKHPRTTQEYPENEQLIDWNDTSWRKGYADGGEVDDDITDALRIELDNGGRVTDRAKYADSDTVSRALALTSEV